MCNQLKNGVYREMDYESKTTIMIKSLYKSYLDLYRTPSSHKIRPHEKRNTSFIIHHPGRSPVNHSFHYIYTTILCLFLPVGYNTVYMWYNSSTCNDAGNTRGCSCTFSQSLRVHKFITLSAPIPPKPMKEQKDSSKKRSLQFQTR